MLADFFDERSKAVIRLLSIAFVVVCTQSLYALEIKGHLIQGGMVTGQVPVNSQVFLDGQALQLSPEGQFVFGLDRDAPVRVELKVISDEIGETVKQLVIQQRQYDIQYIEGIAKKIMQPSEEDRQRASNEAALVRKARSKSLARNDYAVKFQWPLKGPITGVYGSQRVYNGEPRRPHYGVDVSAPVGTPVSVPAPGVVTLVHQDMFYSGGTIIIDHGYGISSTMIHLSKVLARVGDEVKPGDIVAEVGAGGRATGPHLDWRMNWFNARIDPMLLVETDPY
jgi:murein DD-endopeptidase MepM/ murein hydrolase activator NlpD